MNTYYELIKHLKTTFEEDTNVNTVTTEDNPSLIDNYKKNLYPLVHLAVTSSPYTGNDNTALTRYTVEVNVLDIRDINKTEVVDKFWNHDNKIDNLNTTRAILKKAQNKLIKDHLDTDITLESSDSAIPITYAFSNLLDGWVQNWTIDVPDTLTSVC